MNENGADVVPSPVVAAVEDNDSGRPTNTAEVIADAQRRADALVAGSRPAGKPVATARVAQVRGELAQQAPLPGRVEKPSSPVTTSPKKNQFIVMRIINGILRFFGVIQ